MACTYGCVAGHKQRLKDDFWEALVSFHHGLQDQTQGVRLAERASLVLALLAGLRKFLS